MSFWGFWLFLEQTLRCRRSIQGCCWECILYSSWSIAEELWTRGWYLECRSDTLHSPVGCSSLLGRFAHCTINCFKCIYSNFRIRCNFSKTVLLFFSNFTEDEEGTFDAVLRGHVDFESDPWPSISSGAKELVKNMLRRDPKERPTAAQILSKS